jgi:hypothetical protein
MPRGDQYRRLFATYRAHCHTRDDDLTGNDIKKKLSNPSQEALQLVLAISFIAELTQHNLSARQAALEGDFLDMLLRVYVTFYKPNAEGAQSVMVTTFQSALSVLSAEAFHADIVRHHPVYDLWLRGNQLAPCYVPRAPEETLEERCAAWRSMRAPLTKRRLMTIWSVSTRSTNDDAEFQPCADVVEFSR